jgi:hypothetical protein
MAERQERRRNGTRREMREQEVEHGGTTREEKKWNKERNEGGQEVEHVGKCVPPCKAWPTPDMGGTL